MPKQAVAGRVGRAMKITWYDGNREPQCDPNPAYPLGMDIDCSKGAAATCKASLPYPAKRCGMYSIVCETCGFSAVVTTAGRPDDPRSITMPCQAALAAKH